MQIQPDGVGRCGRCALPLPCSLKRGAAIDAVAVASLSTILVLRNMACEMTTTTISVVSHHVCVCNKETISRFSLEPCIKITYRCSLPLACFVVVVVDDNSCCCIVLIFDVMCDDVTVSSWSWEKTPGRVYQNHSFLRTFRTISTASFSKTRWPSSTWASGTHFYDECRPRKCTTSIVDRPEPDIRFRRPKSKVVDDQNPSWFCILLPA